jgi:G3E family GTPase
LKLYHALEGKFILLQDEPEDDKEIGSSEDEMDSESENGSDSPVNSDEGSDEQEMTEEENRARDSEILSNKKNCPYFAGLHRSKGIFWIATRPFQMGSWSTAGAMLTLGSEMPWFCNIDEDDWMADEETTKNIMADFEGEWGDRRQELVMIGERLDELALTKLLDGCLLSKSEMRKWEKVMHDHKLNEAQKGEKLQEIWDDGHWAEWAHSGEADEDAHDHEHHLGNTHRH